MSQEIIQYVGFQTDLSPTAFRVIWTPVALAFKIRGIGTIDLYQAANENPSRGLKFVSRNIWESPEQYLIVFPNGIADEAAFGAVAVTQFGGFAGELTAQDHAAIENLSLAFVNSKPNAARIFERVTAAVPYQFVIENADSPQAEIEWSGKHLVRL